MQGCHLCCMEGGTGVVEAQRRDQPDLESSRKCVEGIRVCACKALMAGKSLLCSPCRHPKGNQACAQDPGRTGIHTHTDWVKNFSYSKKK